jgi:hypothetical protein
MERTENFSRRRVEMMGARILDDLPEIEEAEYSKLVGHFWRHDLVQLGLEKWKECLECGHFEQIIVPLYQHTIRYMEDTGYCQKRSIDLAKEKGTFNPFYRDQIE